MEITRNYDQATGAVSSVLLKDVNPLSEKVITVQSRAEMRYDKVDEYAALMAEGVEFDPCFGVFDETSGMIWIWDGCHRVEAAKKASHKAAGYISVLATYGSAADADWYAYSANAKHGMQRTHDDIERVVKHALQHPRAAYMGNAEIGRHCGVNDKTVGKYRKELELSSEIPRIANRQVTRNGKTYLQKLGKNGGEERSPRESGGKTALPRCLFCHAYVEHIYPSRMQPHVGICIACAALARQHLEGKP